MAFGHSSLRWFEAYSCKSASRGLPSAFVQLRAITDGKKHPPVCTRGALGCQYQSFFYSWAYDDIIETHFQINTQHK